MNARILTVLLLAWPGSALAQGFAGLGQDPGGFSLPAPDPVFQFPEDHGPHPDFRIEWWYLTANLEGADGKTYGAQWTLFRNALAPEDGTGWDTPQIWMGHAGLTTETEHYSTERFARGGIGTAGVTAEPFNAFIDDWAMAGPSLSEVTLTARGSDFAYRLEAKADGPFVPQGAAGYSVKSPEGQASYYYSQPFYTVSGALTLPEGEVSVTGTAWLDREWSSQPLSGDQIGWDWFALNFPDGEKMMAFRLRHEAAPDYINGTWIAADGTPEPIPPGKIAMRPEATTYVEGGGDVPTSWALSLPERGLDITVAAINPRAWMDTAIAYWEGPVRVAGSHPGIGYLEMTGYE
ncbi:MAG: lipocalin-like domain-containing protein [Pseudomonadota bacterium]